MTPEELYQKIKVHKVNINYGKIFVELGNLNTGAWNDVLDTENCGNYQWLASAMDYLKPKQVVELGGAMGVAALCMVGAASVETQIHSITLAEHGLEFSFIKKDYPNLHLIIGDDLNMDNWKGVDLAETDFWYFDSLHTYEQLHAELELYKSFFKQGAVICFDDIHMNDGMSRAWEEVTWPKYESDLHYTGWGISIYDATS